MNENPNHHNQPSDPDFLYALRREMPRSFGEALYAQLGQAEKEDETMTETTLHSPKAQPVRRIMNHTPSESRLISPLRLRGGGGGGVHVLTLAAVMILFVLVGGVILKQVADSSLRSIQPGAQPTPPPLSELVSITEENAASLSRLYTLGNGAVYDVAWSPDGQTIALGTTRGVYVHDADDLGASPTVLGGQQISTTDIVYSLDGTKLAGVRAEGDGGTIYVWDTATGEVLARFQTEFTYPSLLGFTDDGAQLLGYGCTSMVDPSQRYSLCTNVAVARWDAETGERIADLIDLGTPYPSPLTFSSTGEILMYGLFERFEPDRVRAQNSVAVLDLTDGRRATLETSAGSLVALSQDGSKLAVANRSGQAGLELLDIERFLNDQEQGLEEAVLLSQTYASESIISPLVFLPDDAGILAQSGGAGGGYIIYPLDPADAVQTTRMPFFSFNYFALSPDGSRALTELNGDWLEVRDIMSGERLTSTRAYGSIYDSLTFTPDGNTLIAGASSLWGTVRGFDLTTEPPTEIPIQPEAIFGLAGETVDYSVARLIYAPDESQAYYSMRNVHQQIIPVRRDLVTGDTILGQTFGIPGLIAYTPKNELLQLDRGQSVRRYSADLSTTPDYTLVSLQGSPDINVNALPRALFTPDGRMMIASVCLNRPTPSPSRFIGECLEGELRAYSLNSGLLLAALEGEDSLQTSELILTSDGRYLAASSCENLNLSTDREVRSECTAFTLRVWDLSSLYDLLEAEPEDDRPLVPPATTPDEESITRLAPVAISQEFDHAIYGLAFAPVEAESASDSLLLAATDSIGEIPGVNLWRVSLNADTPDEAFTQITRLNTLRVFGLAFSPDGKMLVMGGDGLVELWGTTE